MKIKVCGLTSRQNIEAVLSLRPDFIGLIFYAASPRYIGTDTALATWLRSLQGVAKVGVFVNENAQNIQDTITTYGLGYVQLHGVETPEFCADIQAIAPVIKAFPMHADFEIAQIDAYADVCSYFLFDTPAAGYGGSGRSFDWSQLEHITLPLPFLLSGGIGPGDAGKVNAFRHPAFGGVDLNSRFELSPGIKNYEHLKTFIHEVRR
jgi:phosphoribosylanthranilate isomerase